MLSVDTIKRMAKSKQISTGVMEKDYALSWLLKGLYDDTSPTRENAVLKGGTAIRKIYFPKTWRFSEDLDFTTIDNTRPGEIKEAMEKIFDNLREEVQIEYRFNSYHANKGAIIAKVQFLGPLNHRNIIKLDFSLNEKIILKKEYNPMISEFSDLSNVKITCYSLKEILIEKIRAIMQRGYSRDYYDVWRLLNENYFDLSEIKNFLVIKCNNRNIPYKPELIFNDLQIEGARNQWNKSLGYLMKDIPDFNVVISQLRKKLILK